MYSLSVVLLAPQGTLASYLKKAFLDTFSDKPSDYKIYLSNITLRCTGFSSDDQESGMCQFVAYSEYYI